MKKLIEVCNILSRGKTLKQETQSSMGNIYNIRLTNITDNGKLILEDKYKYNLENISNLLYLYGVQNNDLIFPELTRSDFKIRRLDDVEPNMAIYSARVIFARVNPNIYNPIFLAKLLNSPEYNKKLFKYAFTPSIGYLGIKQIRMNNLKDFEIPDISLEEQNEILKKDLKIRDKIKKLQDDLENLYNI